VYGKNIVVKSGEVSQNYDSDIKIIETQYRDRAIGDVGRVEEMHLMDALRG
jgi:hypothetical protein